MLERRKTKAMAAKHQRTREGISLSSEEEENYEMRLKIKRIQNKPAMTNTYYNSERGCREKLQVTKVVYTL